MGGPVMRDPHQPITPIEPLLVRVEEAARILSLSRSTIYEMLDSGELPSVRRGAARRIPISALHAWIARQLQQNA
jgi:excisionase family DNA binding protein